MCYLILRLSYQQINSIVCLIMKTYAYIYVDWLQPNSTNNVVNTPHCWFIDEVAKHD